jgi:hypothetical protein
VTDERLRTAERRWRESGDDVALVVFEREALRAGIVPPAVAALRREQLQRLVDALERWRRTRPLRFRLPLFGTEASPEVVSRMIARAQSRVASRTLTGGLDTPDPISGEPTLRLTSVSHIVVALDALPDGGYEVEVEPISGGHGTLLRAYLDAGAVLEPVVHVTGGGTDGRGGPGTLVLGAVNLRAAAGSTPDRNLAHLRSHRQGYVCVSNPRGASFPRVSPAMVSSITCPACRAWLRRERPPGYLEGADGAAADPAR